MEVRITRVDCQTIRIGRFDVDFLAIAYPIACRTRGTDILRAHKEILVLSRKRKTGGPTDYVFFTKFGLLHLYFYSSSCILYKIAIMPSIHQLSSFQAHDAVCWYSSWSPDGNEIITCSADKSIKIWSCMGDSWVMKEVLDGIHTKSIRSCEISPDGRYRLMKATVMRRFLAAASFDSNISVYRKEDGEWTFFTMLEGHVNEVKSVSWSQDSLYLASSSR